MLEKLRYKEIYSDFLSKVTLSERQKEILKLSVDGKSIIEISMSINLCDRVVQNELKKIRIMFNNYRRNEVHRIINLIS